MWPAWIAQSVERWALHWVVTPMVASPYQGVKLGSRLGLGIQS